jgi:hypothetical protein
MSLRSGTLVGHYEILQAVGAGDGRGVSRARQETGRDVALKLLQAGCRRMA